MKLELNELLQEIYLWKNLLKEKDEKIENLQKDLLFIQKQNEVLENSRSYLLYEVAERNTAIASLRNSVKKIEMFEADKKTLLEEKQKLKDSLESMEKFYQNESKILTQELLKIEEKNEEKTRKLVAKAQNEASRQLEAITFELEKKEKDIVEYEKQITKLLSEKDQGIMKMKIEYEDKIMKLKQQKSKMQTSCGLQINDIFRQKYLKLKKESEDKILNLEREMESRQLLIESLKSKSVGTSLSSALLTANKPSSIKTDVSVQTENILTDLPVAFNNTVQGEDDFEPLKKISNKSKPVIPRKRKLFNLNENYF